MCTTVRDQIVYCNAKLKLTNLYYGSCKSSCRKILVFNQIAIICVCFTIHAVDRMVTSVKNRKQFSNLNC